VDEALNIEQLVDALIEREGGYVNHPADKGGPTSFGITEAVARAHGYRGPMRQLPRDEAAAIYRRLYWLRPHFDEIARRSPSRPNCSTPARTWDPRSPRPSSSERSPR
jgi:lysozyme family protein